MQSCDNGVTWQNATLFEQAAASVQRLAIQTHVFDKAARLFTLAEAAPITRVTTDEPLALHHATTANMHA
jgi:aerotaxis receptor